MSEDVDGQPRLPDDGRGDEPARQRGAAAEELALVYDGERIAKMIARAGIASRRDVEAMIEAGRVELNGKPLVSPAINVTDADRITVDGEPLPARERTRLWILHKPRGVVTTARDPEGRQTVFDVLPEDLPRVVAIGRLDINTEGLLLLTNDGGLAKVVAHPETGWLRRYRVRAFGDIDQAALDRLRKGVTIDGMAYGPVEATLDRAQGDNVWITLGLREGKNREVKRILEHLGLSVNRLIRLSFGPFQLGDLDVGLVEEVRTKVLKEQLGKTLAERAGVDFESPVREPIAPFGKPKPPGPARRNPPSPDGRKRERPAVRPSRDAQPERAPGRPAKPARVPTGGSGPGTRQSTWHADDARGERTGPRIPRRGGDPKAARAAAAERGRERVGAIKSGERRVLVERLQSSPEAPSPEPHRRVRFRTHEESETKSDSRRSGGRAERAPPRGRSEDRDRPRDPGRADRNAPGTKRGDGRDRPRRFEERNETQNRSREEVRPPRRPRDAAAPRGERPKEPRAGGDRPQRQDRDGGYKAGGKRPGGFKGGGGRGGLPHGRGEAGSKPGRRGPPSGGGRPHRGR